MGYCVFCKSRTVYFCFLHKHSVCDGCLLSPPPGFGHGNSGSSLKKPCQANCVVKKYFSWIEDAEFAWPPSCGHCNRVLNADSDSVIRLPCFCVVHQPCARQLVDAAVLNPAFSEQQQPSMLERLRQVSCPSCNSPLAPAAASSSRSRLTENLLAFLQPESAVSSGHIHSGSGSGNHVVAHFGVSSLSSYPSSSSSSSNPPSSSFRPMEDSSGLVARHNKGGSASRSPAAGAPDSRFDSSSAGGPGQPSSLSAMFSGLSKKTDGDHLFSLHDHEGEGSSAATPDELEAGSPGLGMGVDGGGPSSSSGASGSGSVLMRSRRVGGVGGFGKNRRGNRASGPGGGRRWSPVRLAVIGVSTLMLILFVLLVRTTFEATSSATPLGGAGVGGVGGSDIPQQQQANPWG